MREKNMKFPVILLDSSGHHLEVIEDKQLLTTMTSLALKSRSIIEGHVFDSNGMQYTIKSVTKTKNIYPFWKFEFFNPMVQVKLNVEAKEIVELQTLKKKILLVLNKNSDFWNADGLLETRINAIEGALKHSEAISPLTNS